MPLRIIAELSHAPRDYSERSLTSGAISERFSPGVKSTSVDQEAIITLFLADKGGRLEQPPGPR